ncbi:ParB N-terminal domain-containing protein [Myxococcaceae bacterium JPH2]|nr:ParB N-terminal domain-containing protein [Myxococcaceae bacterium JPH2]
MDAEHRVEGQEGMTGTPEGSPPSTSPEAAAVPHSPGESPRPEETAQPPPEAVQASAEAGQPSAEAGQPPLGEGMAAPSSVTEAAASALTEAASQGSESVGDSGPTVPEEPARSEETPASSESVSDTESSRGEPRRVGRVSTVMLALEKLEDAPRFRLRPEGDISGLATDIARLGQLFPVDVRPVGEDRYQLVCGFRRVAALRFLKRDEVQARVHEHLSDEDALLLSLAEAIHSEPLDLEVLEAKREALESEGRLTAPVRDMLEKALATDESLAPEGVEEEVDADELAGEVAQRMGALNQDLSLLADVFAALDESRKAELLMQLRYASELVAYLEGL